MRNALLAAAAVELAAGVALLAAPSGAAALLLGAGLEGEGAILVSRFLGAAVLALAFAAAAAAREPGGPAAAVMGRTMLLYNLAALAILLHAALVMGRAGPLLWPSVGLHAGLSGWLLRGLRSGQGSRTNTARK
ncbi:MAG: hypothetical protein L6R43_08165 [Planctomycetes bacterium]|nr:hypothetical protein [Planctomycetota bacterium]